MVIHAMQHVANKTTVESIKEKGLLVSDPRERWPGDVLNPPGVYLCRGLDSSYVKQYKETAVRFGKFGDFEVITVDVSGMKVERDPDDFQDWLQEEGWEFLGERWYVKQNIEPERIL